MNTLLFLQILAIAVLFFLSGTVSVAVLRSLHRDIARYNRTDSDSEEDFQQHSGWKLLHGDVFRAPRRGMLLSVFLGSGAQVFVMTFVTLLFACLGCFLSPAKHGDLARCAVALWVLLGSALAGYVSARSYRSFGGDGWKSNALLTALLCPGLVLADFFLMTLVFLMPREDSIWAVAFGVLTAILALSLCVSVPLTFAGAYVGLKRAPIEHPVQTNPTPRQVPWQSARTRPLPGIVMGGLLPFTCIFIQLFILNSLLSHPEFYMFGLLFLVFGVLAVACSQVSVILCYYHLCAEDYRWQWRSFLTSGFSAAYFLAYVVVYFLVWRRVTVSLAETVVYFGLTAIVVLNIFLVTGTVGFFACFWFVTHIYGAVKVD